jgi:hypothetical protein
VLDALANVRKLAGVDEPPENEETISVPVGELVVT